MYTTPRKVKQESRLRRSLSLTNTSRLNGGNNNNQNGSNNGNTNGSGGNATNNAPSYNTSSSGSTTVNINGEDYTSEDYSRHLHDIEESRSQDTSTYFQFNGDLTLQRSRYSYTPGEALTLEPIPDLVDVSTHGGDNSIVIHPDSLNQNSNYPPYRNSGHKPPPYRIPPPSELVLGHQSDDSLIAVTSSDPQHQGVPDSPISLDSLQIHSSKFPFTLDSQTAKDIQQRLANYPLTRANSADLGKAIQSFNEEQTFLMASMQQQQQQQLHHHQQHHQGGRHLDGIDNPALDLGPHSGSNGHIHSNSVVGASAYSSGGNKMSGGGYNYSDSSNSQSLSLSSSNADSLDTVIYKGPQSTTSIRDWQRSMESNGDFGLGHRNDAVNSYRGDSSGFIDGRSYQMQQASSYQQPMQFNRPGGPANGNNHNNNTSNTGSNYAMEYRHSQQQHQVQQNLSVHSIPSSSTGNNGGNVNTLGAGGFSNNNMRSGNGTAYGSNPQLPTKSPMLNHKQFSTSPGQQHIVDTSSGGSSNNTSRASTSTTADPMLVDKSKDSTKLFPTKTYNHIKDMISSRFGGNGVATTNNSSSSASGSNGQGLNNSVPVVTSVNGGSNNGNSSNNNSNSSASASSNPSNSYIDLTMGVPSTYAHSHNNTHHHGNTANGPVINGHSQNMSNSYTTSNGNGNGILANRNQHGGNGSTSYYAPNSASNSNAGNAGGAMMNGSAPNSYRSPNMNDRKNVNTSFRKAIQQSTLKSNLTEDSLQLRPIMEASSQQNYNANSTRGMQYSSVNGNVSSGVKSNPTLGHQQKYDQEAGVKERAQRALDMLMEGGVPLQRTGSGPMVNSTTNPTVYNRIQQFQTSPTGYPGDEGHFTRSTHQPQNQNQSNVAGYPMSHEKSRYHSESNNPGGLNRASGSYNVKPGPGSSNSNSSSGLAIMVESSLSSPGSYTTTGNNRISGNANVSNEDVLNHHQQQKLQSQSHSNNSNSQWAHLHQQSSMINEQPPPLPTSQKPDSLGGSINTIGLPLPSVIPAETRENGDGSSATMETTSGNMLLESSSALCSKSKSDQLKQITTDLQNIALSVAAEQHLHNTGNNNSNNHSSSSECEKGPQRVGSGQSHTTTDSGLGTVMLTKSPLNSNSDPSDHSGPTEKRPNADSVSSGNDSEWVDIVEPEIQQILEIERASKSGKLSLRNPSTSNQGMMKGSNLNSGATTSTPTTSKASQQQREGNSGSSGNPNGINSTNSTSKTQSGNSGNLGDLTASPIPHPRQTHSPGQSPKLPKKFDLNTYNKKASRSQSQELLAIPSTSQGASGAISKVKSPRVTTKVARSNSGSGQRWSNRQQRLVDKKGGRSKDLNQTLKGAKLTRNAMNKLGQILYSLQDDNEDMTSTTGLDFESALDGHTEFTTDDDDLSTTIDTTDAHAIRRQLESLESMYTEVLKVLGEKKFSRNRYPPNTAELRAAKRRPYGSMSSLPSSVSSRPFRERSRKFDEKKKVKDLKSINRRFQRLESHVVTLARSVAHLSSEMRTQHLMVQEMESIRNELQQLRNQVVKNSMQNQSAAAAAAAAAQNFNRGASGRHGGMPCANQTDWTSFRNALPSLTNPCRVRKLTKFFGDEPPLIRIFLKKLGYEKYAPAFEQERIGIMELPYLTEERLNKMGIPMGPRLRILQEAQMCLKPGYHGQHDGHHSHHPNNHNTGNLSVYVV